MKKSSSKTSKEKQLPRKKSKDLRPLYESKVLSWENILEVDETEIDFSGEDFGLDFPISVLENHRKQSKEKAKEKEK